MSGEAFYVGGEWREPAGPTRVDVIDSFTEEVVAQSPVATGDCATTSSVNESITSTRVGPAGSRHSPPT